MALYEPGLGYYASGRIVVGRMPESGSDFVTAPELSPLFGRALARQVAAGARRVGQRRGLGVRRRLRRARGRAARRARPAHPPLLDRRAVGAAARAPARRDARVRRRRPLARRAARADERRRHRQRGARRDAGRPAALRRHAPGSSAASPAARASARSSSATGRRRCGRRTRRRCRPARRPRPMPRREAFVATLAERHGAGRGLLRRLRLSGERVLPPAALAGHPDVPPRAPRRHRSRSSMSASRTSPRMSTSPASPSPARTPGFDVAGYTSQARFLLNCGIGELMERASLRARAEAAMLAQRARDGRAVQGDRLHQGPAPITRRSASPAATGAIACSSRP